MPENKAKTYSKYKGRNELVTKQYLHDVLQNFRVEFKTELREEITNEFERYIGAVMEDNRHHIKMLAEGIAMQIEIGQKKWEEQKVLNELHDWRLKMLEAKVA